MDSDSDVEVTGESGFNAARDAPHARPDCITHPFKPGAHGDRCDFCYCWVCDDVASKCTHWTAGCDGRTCSDACDSCPSHSHATPARRRWVTARAEAKRQQQSRELAEQRARAARPPTAARPPSLPPPQAAPSAPAAVDATAGDPASAAPSADETLPPAAGDAESAGIEGDDEESEELFEHYKPCHFPHGSEHPDPVVETTSLAFVQPPRFADTGQLLPGILQSCVAHRTLSALQLEAVAYAGLRHEQTLSDPAASTAGFFLGDGPGVGKGRQLAAIILENWLAGRKRHVWLSVSPDLEHDASRDLKDLLKHLEPAIGEIPIVNLTRLSYRDISLKAGVLFCTYSALVAKEGLNAAEKDRQAALEEGDEDAEKDATAATTSGAAKRTRLEQIVRWMNGGVGGGGGGKASVKGEGAGAGAGAGVATGCVLFDECHKAKNLVMGSGGGQGTLTGRAVLELQEHLPKARVVYCSATGASSVKNMAYMVRLGLWGPGTAFENFGAFDKAIDKAGVGAMELIALDMKQRGMYLSRNLSYKDATFETINVQLDERQTTLYDRCALFWQAMQECFESALEQLHSCDGWVAPKHAMAQFWGAHQRFFKQLCMSVKVPQVVRVAQECRAKGYAVVVGLQTTGEARMVEALKEAGEEGLEDFAGLYAIIENLLETQFPTRGDKEEDDDADPDDPMLADEDEGHDALGDVYAPRRPSTKRSVPKQKAAAAASSASSLGGGLAGAAGSSSSASAAAKRAVMSDSDDSDEELSMAASEAKHAAIEGAPRKFKTYSPTMLVLAVGAFITSEYKLPKQRDDRLRKLLESYKGIWALGTTQLRRRLFDLGVHGEAKPTGKAALVEAVYARTVACHYHLLAAAGEEVASLPHSELARALGLSATDPLLADGVGGAGGGAGGGEGGGAGGGAGGVEGFEQGLEVGAAARQRLLSGSLRGLKEELLREAASLSLPDNPLDQLIHALGGTEKVAELTGRKMKLVYDAADGRARMVKRAKELDVTVARVNMAEKEAFMNGQKMVAIISEAASSGISLHADRRFANRAKRIHITLELPWSADEALQQLGRTHRSNQTSAPDFKLLMTTLGGERRFAAQLAKRLQHLGALTKGDRRAADAANLSSFDFQTQYGRRALERLVDSIRTRSFGAGRMKLLLERVLGAEAARLAADTGDLTPWNEHCEELETALQIVGIDLTLDYADRVAAGGPRGKRKDLPSVKTFLNRLLGLTVRLQGRCFAHFNALFEDEIAKDKSEGRFDDGVVDMKATSIAYKDEPVPFYTDPTTKARTTLYTLQLDRGCEWSKALAELDAANAREAAEGHAGAHINGIYHDVAPYSTRGATQRRHHYVAIRKPYQSGEAQHNPHYEIYKLIHPNFGYTWTIQRAALEERRTYTRYNLGDERAKARAQREWTAMHTDSARCWHAPPCSCKSRYGSKFVTEAVIAGSILPLWKALDELTVVLNGRGDKKPMRVTRVRLSAGTRIVGVKVPYARLQNWQQRLAKAGVKMDAEALGIINLIEKDALEAESRTREEPSAAKAEGADGAAGAAGAATAGAAAAGGRPGKRKADDSGFGRREINTDYW